MPDLDTFMRAPCPAGGGQSRYWCKIAGDCTCSATDDLAVYERQQAWRWGRNRSGREPLPDLTYGWQCMARFRGDP